MGCCYSLFLHRRCSSKNQRIREDLLESDASGVYGAYQSFMGNIQTVSTLLLGFLITGTLLSVMLTGRDNYGADKVCQFTTKAVASVLFSGTSMLLGFVVQARGTSAYENFGAVRAVKSMRRSTCCIGIAESCIYLSLICFMWSLEDYIMMNFIGPDICPYTQRDTPSSESFCSQLGMDFYWAMQLSCGDGKGSMTEEKLSGRAESRIRHRQLMLGGDFEHIPRRLEARTPETLKVVKNDTKGRQRVDSNFVCQQYRHLKESEELRNRVKLPLTPMNFAVWDCAMWKKSVDGQVDHESHCESAMHLQLMNDVSEVLCVVGKMSALRRNLCGKQYLDNGEKCSQAYTAYRKAMECVDSNMEDAKMCYQVCQWTDNQPPRIRLQNSVGQIIHVSNLVIFVVFICRWVRGAQQTAIVISTDKAPLVRQLAHQAFVKDPESSEEEEMVNDQVKSLNAIDPADTTDGIPGFSRFPLPLSAGSLDAQFSSQYAPSPLQTRPPTRKELKQVQKHLGVRESSSSRSSRSESRRASKNDTQILRGWGDSSGRNSYDEHDWRGGRPATNGSEDPQANSTWFRW